MGTSVFKLSETLRMPHFYESEVANEKGFDNFLVSRRTQGNILATTRKLENKMPNFNMILNGPRLE